ncbi:MAG TPA: hypothetical protein ENO23_01585, partial [Alphaproteobacteria bacterium]|nr:hypothetical protein [Alphaproteobacteria bacterium]
MDLSEASLETVLEFFGVLTGKAFVLSPGVDASLNAFAGAPAPADPMAFLHALLRPNALVAEDHGSFVVVRPRREQAQMAGPVIGAGEMPEGYETVTRVIPTGPRSDEFLRDAQRLAEPDGALGVVGSAAVAVGSAAGTRRIAELAEGLDESLPPTAVRVVPLRNVSAQVAAQALVAVAPEDLRIVPHPMGGALVMVGPDAKVEKFAALAARLDSEAPTADERISVLRLDYAEAGEVANLVSTVVGRGKDERLS